MGRRERVWEGGRGRGGWGGGRGDGKEEEGGGEEEEGNGEEEERGMGRKQREDFVKWFPHGVLPSQEHMTPSHTSHPHRKKYPTVFPALGYVGPSQVDPRLIGY